MIALCTDQALVRHEGYRIIAAVLRGNREIDNALNYGQAPTTTDLREIDHG